MTSKHTLVQKQGSNHLLGVFMLLRTCIHSCAAPLGQRVDLIWPAAHTHAAAGVESFGGVLDAHAVHAMPQRGVGIADVGNDAVAFHTCNPLLKPMTSAGRPTRPRAPMHSWLLLAVAATPLLSACPGERLPCSPAAHAKPPPPPPTHPLKSGRRRSCFARCALPLSCSAPLSHRLVTSFKVHACSLLRALKRS